VQYKSETDGIEVAVEPYYLDDESRPDHGRYFWAYVVEIRNNRSEPVQLRYRYWTITDGLGRVEEVEGPGVVGEEPWIAPGDVFEYTSGCPLGTSSGIMVGSYIMEDRAGRRFQVAIPAFSLDLPDVAPSLN